MVEKWSKVCQNPHSLISPGPFNGYHEMDHNSAITRQNQLEFFNQKAKQVFSKQSKNFDP